MFDFLRFSLPFTEKQEKEGQAMALKNSHRRWGKQHLKRCQKQLARAHENIRVFNREAPVRFGSVTVWEGTVQAVPVLGSGGSSAKRVFLCFSRVYQERTVPVPVSVPGKRFRRLFLG